MLNKLNRSTAALPLDKPVKVLQFGKGNFLRAFTDWMVDVLNEKTAFGGAVQIVQSNSTETDDRFKEQNGLYHVVINGIRNGAEMQEIRLISCVGGVVNPFDNYAEFMKAGENPHLEFIVSNTTEAGIQFDSADRGPETCSKTFPGKLTALLHHRYRFFQGDPRKAVTLLPCELIEKNGEALLFTVLQYISHWNLEDGFKKWISHHTRFCNTLVDRIVPGFPKNNIHDIWEKTGYKDDLAVSAEPYHLWVIEPVLSPAFSIEKLRTDLPLERAGINAKFVDDLAPYRTSKVRILNGAHTCMVPIAWLQGLRTVKEAIDDPIAGAFIRDIINEEIIPTLDLPKEELQQFANDVIERFQNPFIRHELMSIALNSVAKFQVRVLPSMLEFHRRFGKLPERLLRSLAALILFYKGEWKGEVIKLKDSPEVLSFFAHAWTNKNPDAVVEKVLSNQLLWKTDLSKIDGMVASVRKHLDNLANNPK